MILTFFNASGRDGKGQILLACNVKLFRMVLFDMFKLAAVRGELLSM
jgi:hypothetical protein